MGPTDLTFPFNVGDTVVPSDETWPAAGYFVTVKSVGDVKFFGIDQAGNEYAWRIDIGWKPYTVRRTFTVTTERRLGVVSDPFVRSDTYGLHVDVLLLDSVSPVDVIVSVTEVV